MGRAPSVPTAAGGTAPGSAVGSLDTASRGPSPAPGFREAGAPAAGAGGAPSALLGPTAAGVQDMPAASVPVPSTSLLGGQPVVGPSMLRGKTPSPAPGAQGCAQWCQGGDLWVAACWGQVVTLAGDEVGGKRAAGETPPLAPSQPGLSEYTLL